MFKTYTLLFILLLPLSCLAQFTISGKVLNQADKKPVANASVFLSNATIGDISAENGTFSLPNVKSGKYTLVVSVVGYETITQTILVNRSNIKLDDIYISGKTIALKEVNIKPDPNREQYLTMFKAQFLGKTELAQQCKILNPDVLDFDYDDKTSTLTATSTDFLQISNPALGYNIKYQLVDFVWINDKESPTIKYIGNYLFEPLKGTPAEQRRWEKRRYEVYKNSTMHFYRSVIADRVTEEGFKIQQYGYAYNPNRPMDSVLKARMAYWQHQVEISYEMEPRNQLAYWKKKLEFPEMIRKLYPYPLAQQDLLTLTNQPGLFALGCDMNGLFVTYNENHRFDNNIKVTHVQNPNNEESTLISFDSPFAFVDRNGIIANPYAISYMGVWADKRIADLLPIDYDPPQNEIAPAEAVDSTVTKKVIAGLSKYSAEHPTEKAYLQFDKPYYAASDTMYFKAYVTSGGLHVLSQLSGILHVDLINNSNSKIEQSINLEITDGVAWGDFALPDSLPKGNYRVRAYTQLMRNKGEADFFEKTVSVGSVLPGKIAGSNTNKQQPVSTAKADIQFFPEGGSIVSGIKSKVAFKAIGPDGLGISVKGEVVDDQNKQVSTFSSMHLGMGYFYLNAEQGRTYKAKITYPNGTQDAIDLPASNTRAIVLSVTSDSTKLAVNIQADKAYFNANRNKDHTLIIYSGGSVISIICKLDSTVVPVGIYRQELHTGIARITLFSPSGEPLSERLVFIQNNDQLKLNIKTDKAVFAPRAKVNIDLAAINIDSEPVGGHFSVAVTDESKVPVDEKNERTILSDLLLTSDLKGYVEQPNYYFTTDAAQSAASLDVLMLTQGYRGFEWKQVFNTNTPSTVYPPENSFELSGVVKTLTGKPVADGHITLLSTKQNVVRDTVTDANGNFKFTGLYLTDTAQLVLHAIKKNNSSYVKIELNKADYPAVVKVNSPDSSIYSISPDVASAMKLQYEQSGSIKTGILLKQVNIKNSTNPLHLAPLTHSANLNGAGNADQVILGSQLTGGCLNLVVCLQAILHGVRYSGTSSDPVIYSLRTPIALIGPTKPMAIMVDGTIRDQQVLAQLSYTDIYSIEVLLSNTYLTVYGSQASGGLIVITTKRGDEYSTTSTDGTINYTFNGFYKARTFYAPKYEAAAPVNNKPDARSTIFWSPELTTNNSGNAAFNFYNADKPGTYRVVVEGIDERGNIGRRVYHYKVQ